MLKIKDDVDLKELEKFGFEPEIINYPQFDINNEICAYKKDCKNKSDAGRYKYIIEVHYTSRKLYISGDMLEFIPIDKYNFNDFALFDLDTIYDLFQAGLIEKVGE